MKPLKNKLSKNSRNITIIQFNSFSLDKEVLFSNIDRAMDKHATNILIGHSLGGVLSLDYCERQAENGGDAPLKTIMLGSPINQSLVASKLKWMPPLSLCKEAVNSLLRGGRTIPKNTQVTSIYGSNPVGFFTFIVGKDSDGTVAINETHIPGLKHHIGIHVSHMGIIYSNRTIAIIEHVLSEGE